jgi:hypothetical protein
VVVCVGVCGVWMDVSGWVCGFACVGVGVGMGGVWVCVFVGVIARVFVGLCVVCGWLCVDG